MHAYALVALVLLAACSQPAAVAATSSRTATPVATPVSSLCRLPVWWSVGQDIHASFVSVPDGAVTDAGILPLFPTYGASYDLANHSWVRSSREAVSPDGRRFAYWTGSPTNSEVHVVDVATGADHLAYSGITLFIVVSFQSDGIYLAHAIYLRTGVFEKLYRLDPAGGTPQLVPGSDRHMYQWGWVLIADGAAWGIDNMVQGNGYLFSVLRLDLATSQVTTWVEGQNSMFWPYAVDRQHRLYAAAYNGPLLRIDSPGHVVGVPSPEDSVFSNAIGGPNSFVADSMGVWFSAQGGVWLYVDGHDPKKFAVGPNDTVWPAGPCAPS